MEELLRLVDDLIAIKTKIKVLDDHIRNEHGFTYSGAAPTPTRLSDNLLEARDVLVIKMLLIENKIREVDFDDPDTNEMLHNDALGG